MLNLINKVLLHETIIRFKAFRKHFGHPASGTDRSRGILVVSYLHEMEEFQELVVILF